MKNIVYIVLSIIWVVNCSEMETKWEVKFEPAGPGNYRINGISSSRTYASPNNYDHRVKGNFFSKTHSYVVTGAFWTDEKESVCITANYDADGELIWHTVYESQGLRSSKGNAIRAITGEIVEVKHDIYVLAQTTDLKGVNAVVLIQYDSLGNVQWDKVIEKSRGEITSALLSDHLNNLYIAGWTTNSAGSIDIFIAKYRPSGELVWLNKYHYPTLVFHALKFSFSKNGQFLVAGHLKDNKDFFFMKYDSLGQLINLTKCETSIQEISLADARIDEHGNVYLLGTTHNDKTGEDYVTVVYDKNDSLLFEKCFDGPAHQDDVANALIVEDSYAGSLYVFAIGSSDNEDGVSEVLTVKYDLTGNEIWTKAFKGRKNELAKPYLYGPRIIRSPTQHDVNNFYITGYVGDDVLLLKHNTKGFISWFTRYAKVGTVCRPTAFRGFCIGVESVSDKGSDAYLIKFGKAEQLGIIRWD